MTMSETEWVACVIKLRTARTKLRAGKVVMIRMSEEPATGYAQQRLYSGQRRERRSSSVSPKRKKASKRRVLVFVPWYQIRLRRFSYHCSFSTAESHEHKLQHAHTGGLSIITPMRQLLLGTSPSPRQGFQSFLMEVSTFATPQAFARTVLTYQAPASTLPFPA